MTDTINKQLIFCKTYLDSKDKSVDNDLVLDGAVDGVSDDDDVVLDVEKIGVANVRVELEGIGEESSIWLIVAEVEGDVDEASVSGVVQLYVVVVGGELALEGHGEWSGDDNAVSETGTGNELVGKHNSVVIGVNGVLGTALVESCGELVVAIVASHSGAGAVDKGDGASGVNDTGSDADGHAGGVARDAGHAGFGLAGQVIICKLPARRTLADARLAAVGAAAVVAIVAIDGS